MTVDRSYYLFACGATPCVQPRGRRMGPHGERLGGIDIGKFFTRILTPSERQITALEKLAPMAASFVGAATGTQALTQAGAAFGGVALPGSSEFVAMGGGASGDIVLDVERGRFSGSLMVGGLALALLAVVGIAVVARRR